MGGDSKRTTFSSRRDTYWLRKSLHETFVLYGLKLLRETPMTHVSVPRKIGVFDGRDVFEVELISQTGVEISLINYAALIRDWKVPLKGERKRSIVCGFDNFEDYPLYSPYFGAIIGRVANRIGGSKFKIDGKEYALAGNEGKNHLHGGPRGLGRQVWDMNVVDDDDGSGRKAVKFTIRSPDGEMGYPGNLNCTVTYRLIDYRLKITLEASTDAATPVNLVQHNYFNLMNDGKDIRDHRLWVNSEETLSLDDGLVPTGDIESVKGTLLDFTQLKSLKDNNRQPLRIDNSFILRKSGGEDPVTILESPDNQLILKLWTDQPSLHVYTGGGMNLQIAGASGQHYPCFGAICLEDQNYTDAVNHPNFPCPILRPPDVYKHHCEIEVTPQ